MLHEFLTENRDELTKRCTMKVAKRLAPAAAATALEFGIPLFLKQLISTLRAEEKGDLTPRPAGPPGEPDAHADEGGNPGGHRLGEIGSTASKHGNELLRHGFTVDQVVHDYGDLCQAITELAHEQGVEISVLEFHTFNSCLDNAMADAVSEFGRVRDQRISEAGAQSTNERLGYLAHELRNLLNSAVLALQAIKSGNVALNGATGAILGRSLTGMRDLIDRSLAEVRLTQGVQVRRESILVDEFIAEIEVSAGMEANDAKIGFTSMPVEKGLRVDADRQMLAAAVSNLLQNAFKFSQPNGHVTLTVRSVSDRLLIEIADQCGGLPDGKPEALFQPFSQRGNDRSGLGLGLSISRRSVEANGGKLTVRNFPGTGCVFSIDMPRRPST